MKPIKLPILYHSEESKKLADLDLPIDENTAITKDVMFCTINCVMPRFDPDGLDEDSCEISSGAELFVCTLPQSEVEKRILKAL